MKKLSLGKSFRRARENRGLNQAKAGEGVIAKSTLSDFENEKTDIKSSNILGLLRNLNISFQELLYIGNDYELEGFTKIWIQAYKHYYEKNIRALRSLLQREKANLDDQNLSIIYDELNYLQLKNLVSRIDSSFALSSSEKNKVIDYLNSTKYWTYYDLALYGNILDVFDSENIQILSDKIVLRTSFFKSIPENKRLIAEVLVNTMSEFLNRGELNRAIHFQKQVENELEETDVFVRVIFLFVMGELEHYKGMSSGREKMQAAIDIFDRIGSQRIADQYQKNYDRIIKKSENL